MNSKRETTKKGKKWRKKKKGKKKWRNKIDRNLTCKSNVI